MAVKVMITRRFKKGFDREVLILLNQLRAGAINQPGYITGETIVCRDDPQKLVVMSTWEDDAYWERWNADPVRKALEDRLDQMLVESVKCDVFNFGFFPNLKQKDRE